MSVFVNFDVNIPILNSVYLIQGLSKVKLTRKCYSKRDVTGPAERIFKGGGGGLTRKRKREPTRGVRGHAPPGKFEILFF